MTSQLHMISEINWVWKWEKYLFSRCSFNQHLFLEVPTLIFFLDCLDDSYPQCYPETSCSFCGGLCGAIQPLSGLVLSSGQRLLFEAEPSGKLSELERPGAGGLVRCSLMMSVAVRVIQIRRLGKFLPKTLDEHTHTLYIYIYIQYIYTIYIWKFPEIGVPPNHLFYFRLVHETKHPFLWGTPLPFFVLCFTWLHSSNYVNIRIDENSILHIVIIYHIIK